MPSIGMLLCKDHSNDPPTSAASAHPPLTEAPSTSKSPHATTSDPTSSDDGPPPPKSRRQTMRTINAAKRQGSPLEAEQVPMSKKQSKRAYKEASSTADGKAGSSRPSKKRAPLADVTNSAAVPAPTSTRPKRAATKRLDLEWSDSASDGGSSSSSDFMPDADHVSEVCAELPSDSNGNTRTPHSSRNRKSFAGVASSPVDSNKSIEKPFVETQSTTGNQATMPAAKRATSKSSAKITMEELRKHMANISQHWNRDSKVLLCPVCRRKLKAPALSVAGNHVVRHLDDRTLLPYLCPTDNCDVASMEQISIKKHVKDIHSLDWTDELAAASVHEENKARLDALFVGIRKEPKVGMEELRNHMANISQHWNRDSKVLQCPVCNCEVKAPWLTHAGIHVVSHLDDKTLFPYLCPIDNCSVVSMEQFRIKKHVASIHKLAWTRELAAASVHAENKARLDALFVCRRKRSNDPPTTTASALLPSAEDQSTSSELQPTTSDRASPEDAPPPSKSRSHTALTSNTAKRTGTPLKVVQVPTSRKQSKHTHAVASSTESSKKGTLFEDLTNCTAVRSTTRPKRDPAAKTPTVVDSSDSASDKVVKESVQRELPAEPQSTTGNRGMIPAVKRIGKTHLMKIGMEEVRKLMANINQHWNRESKVLWCPVCGCEVKAGAPSDAGNHVIRHLDDKTLFPYICPLANCGVTSTEQCNIRKHVVFVHKRDWTRELAAASVHEENKARLDALYIGIGMDHSNDAATTVGSARLPSAGGPPTSRELQPAASNPASPEDAPPPSKRPKRTAAKPLHKDLLDDSASDEDDSTSSAFEPGADHVSEDDTDTESPSDPDDDDQDDGATPSTTGRSSSFSAKDDAYAVQRSGLDLDTRDVGDKRSYTGELLTSWYGTLIDSAQLTVFDCPPPLIPCHEVPQLKLFHELTDAERDIFEKSDKIESSCTFCNTAPTKEDRINGTGTSGLYEHFYNRGDFHVCTWPGCTMSFSSFKALLWHYGSCHDRRYALFKCDKCKYVAHNAETLATHVKRPHPASEEEAKTTSSLNCKGRLVLWKNPELCDKCEKWYPENERTRDEIHHSAEMLEFDNTLPAQGVQIPCLRDGTCPFDDCDEPYRDFIGWYLHCTSKHPEYILAAGRSVPYTLTTEERERLPMFRCTTCFMCVPLAQVYRHHEKCAARMLPESIGPLMRQRAAVYNMEPCVLELVYGQVVMKERRFAGLLHEVLVSAPDPQRMEASLRAIRSDPFLRSFTRRNQGAPVSSVLYVVSRIRHNNVPEIGEWAKDRIVYVGSTTDVTARVRKHTADTLSKWHDMGLTLEADEDMYLIRMCVTLDKQTSVASFNDPDLKRLEQALIDALGMGTLYNVKRVLSAECMMNDVTYRNHIAPRLYQLALVFLQSTHTRLKKTSFGVDNKNVWKLPVTRRELNNIIRQATEPATRVDQACSPIPFPRILSPEVHDVLSRFQAERGFTDEEMTDWVLTRKARGSISSGHVGYLETNESVQPDDLDERPVSSPDLFAYLYSEEPEEETPACYNPFDFADVPTTSNGPDLHALEDLRASMVHPSTPSQADGTEPDESHMPAGDSVPFGPARQPSRDLSDSALRSEGSASKTSPAKNASGFLAPLVIGNRTVRIPRYGHRCTQYVDLDREPVSLTQDSASDASLDDESQQALADASSVSSDEEPPQGFPDDSSESSLGEPSPADSGIDIRFNFEPVPGTDADPNVEDSADETTPKKPAKTATASRDGDKEDAADADLYDNCAHTNCRRPQHENINWVQCDDCDVWYHNLCILGTEKPVEEDEFHCGCAENGKHEPGQKHYSK